MMSVNWKWVKWSVSYLQNNLQFEHSRSLSNNAEEDFNLSRRVKYLYIVVDVVAQWILTRPVQFKPISTIFCVGRSRPVMVFQSGCWSRLMGFLDGSPLLGVHQVDSNYFTPCRQQIRSIIPRQFLVWRTYFLERLRLSEGGPENFNRWTHGGQVRKASNKCPSPRRPSCDVPRVWHHVVKRHS